MKKNKKDSLKRRKLEISLINSVSSMAARGSFFNVCLDKDASNSKYKIAKKRYSSLLDEVERSIKDIRNLIDNMEGSTKKEQKKKRFEEEDEEDEYLN